jgi:hypothetical protein
MKTTQQLTNDGLTYTVETITPKVAEGMLNRNTINRSLRPGLAEKYERDMKIGKWGRCTAPIVFYDTGDVADGQHRLLAICTSGVPQTFLVLRGLPRPEGLNIDTGGPRTLVDNARISGLDVTLNNTIVAVAKGMEMGDRSTDPLSNSQVLSMVAKHRRAAEWASHHGPVGRFLRNAMVLSAIGRACYYEKDMDRLARFSEVVRTGFAEGPKESAAIALRNYLQMKGQANVRVGGALWRDTFLKAMNAIHYFMRGKPLTIIKVVKDEAYPLPGTKKK